MVNSMESADWLFVLFYWYELAEDYADDDEHKEAIHGMRKHVYKVVFQNQVCFMLKNNDTNGHLVERQFYRWAQLLTGGRWTFFQSLITCLSFFLWNNKILLKWYIIYVKTILQQTQTIQNF